MKRYDIAKDEMVEITQEWVDMAQRDFQLLGRISIVIKSQLTQAEKLKEIERMLKHAHT